MSVAILGTAAIEEPDRLSQLLSRFGSRIAVSLDVRGRAVQTRGWVAASQLSSENAAVRLAEAGLEDLIVTDVARDGELSGPDVPLFARAARAFGRAVIAAGGIASEEDLKALEREPSIRGAVVGKAFYEGTVSLSVLRRSP